MGELRGGNEATQNAKVISLKGSTAFRTGRPAERGTRSTMPTAGAAADRDKAPPHAGPLPILGSSRPSARCSTSMQFGCPRREKPVLLLTQAELPGARQGGGHDADGI